MDAITTRRQSVDFLGFLRSQLSGLQGIPTLCYELIQNADDVKDINGDLGATRITFDVCDDALYVENDGVFRDVDFDRMEKLSSGGKRDEAGTTGAFGIGFISVYQITDSPEIFSSDQHWRFDPSALEEQRIQVQQTKTHLTRFRLPWAFDMSKIRQELGIQSIQKDQLDQFTKEINLAIENAALFLNQISTLELKRSGKLLRRIEKLAVGNQVLLADGNITIGWRIFEGNFTDQERVFRQRYGEIIEGKRQSTIKIALPEKPITEGLLYAFLPSESKIPLPFHINADFYPSQDRKRILFDQDYKSEWNRAAIRASAKSIANSIDEILEHLSPIDFWDFAETIYEAKKIPGPDPVFAEFWSHIESLIRNNPTVLTVGKQVKVPSNTFFLDTEEEKAAADIFENLKISVVSPELRQHRNLLLSVGVNLLTLEEIASSIKAAGLNGPLDLKKAPNTLQNHGGWKALWGAMNLLWNKKTPTPALKQTLRSCSIAFGVDGSLCPPAQLYDAEETTRRLFGEINWVQLGSESFIVQVLVNRFAVNDAIGFISGLAETSSENQSELLHKVPDYYMWLEDHRQEISKDGNLIRRLREIAMWPTANGQLKPLERLYLTGEFDDPLNLAQIINVKLLGGRKEFLEDVLEVKTLDFLTYIKDWLPEQFEKRQLSTEELRKLVFVIAQNFGKIANDQTAKEILQDLALIECADGEFRESRQVYFSSQDLSVLGNPPQALIPNQDNAIQTFYEWLGVPSKPRPQDILDLILNTILQKPTRELIAVIERVFSYLVRNWVSWDDAMQQSYSQLKNTAWLPGTLRSTDWNSPSEVFAINRDYLFLTQGNFLAFDRKSHNQSSKFADFLGINDEPSIKQVVNHLLACSKNGENVNSEVYVFLSYDKNIHSSEIDILSSKQCLLLRATSGEEKYYYPRQVFWEEHPFGAYRYRLATEFGRFKPLYDRIGVRTRPEADDAVDVLLEISTLFGASNMDLDDDAISVVISCWKFLEEALDQERIRPEYLRSKLSKKKVIPDNRKILEPPDYLYFEDRPGLAAKFKMLRDSVTKRIDGAWRAMEAAGVRRLSDAVSVQLHECENTRQDSGMQTLIQDRLFLIRRVLNSQKVQAYRQSEQLLSIDYQQAETISILQTFHGYNRTEILEPESVDAVMLDNTLYIAAMKNRPWPSIARELALYLQLDGEIGSLAIELKEVLSSPTPEDADKILDQFGYPRLSVVDGPMPKGGILEEIETTSGELGTLPEGGGRNDSGGGSGGSGTGDGKDTGKKGKPESGAKRRKTSRIVSYVYPEGTEVDHEPQTQQSKRDKVAKAGVAHVINHERKNKRVPTDMETIQVNHPGYDIESVDLEGNIRYIEVKSLSGVWDSSSPAMMTKTEFSEAKKHGENFWLYIVEDATGESPLIYKIQDPANKAGYYLFDYGWIGLAEAAI